MAKVDINKDMLDNLICFCGGNPGALSQMMIVASKYSEIDPQAALGPWHFLDFLETMEFTPGEIYDFCRHLCLGNPVIIVAFVRAHQLGLMAKNHIRCAVSCSRHVIDVDHAALLLKVKTALPSFNTERI